jgi:hypothetical protein
LFLADVRCFIEDQTKGAYLEIFMDFEFIIFIFLLSPKRIIDTHWFIVQIVANKLANLQSQ